MTLELDRARDAVIIGGPELHAALAVAAGGAEPDPAGLRALREAGALEDELLRRLVAVVAAPKLRLVVERFLAEQPVTEEAWAVEALAVWGTPAGGDAVELSALEPALLAWEVARRVGLGARPAAAGGELRLPASVLDAAFAALAAGDPGGADAALGAGTALDGDERARFLALLAARRSSWRASAVWTAEGGVPVEGSIAVVDGGDSGLWLSEHEPGPDGEPVVRLVPTTPGAVWERVTGLLPPMPPEGPP